MRTVGHLTTKISTVFGELDEDANNRQEFPLEWTLRVVTPLTALEWVEGYYTQKNALRQKLGLPPEPVPLGLAEAKAAAAGALETAETRLPARVAPVRPAVGARNGEG